MGLSLEYKKTPCILERNSEKYFKDLDPDMNFHDLIRLDVIICEWPSKITLTKKRMVINETNINSHKCI